MSNEPRELNLEETERIAGGHSSSAEIVTMLPHCISKCRECTYADRRTSSRGPFGGHIALIALIVRAVISVSFLLTRRRGLAVTIPSSC